MLPDLITGIEKSLVDFTTSLIVDIAHAKKTRPWDVAGAVPGLQHTHQPTTFIVPECVYCQRRGNVFCAQTGHGK
jgi:hypothetical protein